MKVQTVRIVSLSRGILGEPFVRHELDLGVRRLEAMGLTVQFAAHALQGLDFVRAHPELRAQDLLDALRDPVVDMILCAIGGDDTYWLLPSLFGNGELARVASRKIFLGYSDSTMNHLMLHKVGVPTFYGQAFLTDVAELDREMLPYSKSYFEELIRTGRIEKITPSDVWYEERTDFSEAALGTPRTAHPNGGFELLQGKSVFEGAILGGCIDALFDIFDGTRYADSPALCARYGLFPSAEEWRGKILLLESSEEKAPPQKYRRMLAALKDAGVFGAVSGILVGKPQDDAYHDEYKAALVEAVADSSLPILCNVSVGHATPHCIIPFGVHATVDAGKQEITFRWES